MQQRLLAVAHGTALRVGPPPRAERLVDAVRAAPAGTSPSTCASSTSSIRGCPTLLAAYDRPAVVVPLLLSTGYHVQTDIPGRRRRRTRRSRVARHLGPHPLLVDALVDRLAALPGDPASVRAGRRRLDAARRPRAELAETARLLGARLGTASRPRRWPTTCRAALAAARAPVHVATYLLAEGQFAATLRRRRRRRRRAVAAPLGVHPALVELVWRRYDEASRTVLGYSGSPARPGSSVGTSDRLKSGRSAVRPCPWPPAGAEQRLQPRASGAFGGETVAERGPQSFGMTCRHASGARQTP